MRNAFQEVITQINGIWSRLDSGQRLVVSVVLAATVAGLSAIVWFAGQPSYETVYIARTNEEIERVERALQQAGVAWQVGAGRSFLVERGKIDLANMAIAKEGLTGASTTAIGGGLSLVEDAETKAWKLDAATRASAEAAIQQLEGVVQAIVTASRPRKVAAFRDRDAENRPSATVMLKLRPGAGFDAVARAAASIAGSQLMVPPTNIEVVSSTGSQRYRYDPDRDTGSGTSEFLTLQRTMGEDRTRLAQERLDQLWPGKSSVAVSVELDPSWEIRSEKMVPTEAIVMSETVKKDATESSIAKGDTDGNRNTSKNEVKERKYVTDIGERRSGKLMPEIKRLTVAVLYDRTLQNAQGFNKTDLENVVKAIVGWDPSRDKPDAFSTLVGDFAPAEPAAEPAAGPGIAETALRWGPTVGQALGVLVVVMFLRGLFRRAGKASIAVSTDAAQAKVEAAEENVGPEEQQKRMRREIERSIAEDPAALAKLFESWLVEQKN